MHVKKPLLVVRAPGELSAYVPTTLAREEPYGICSFCPIAGVARSRMEESCHDQQGESGGAVWLWAICSESECREQNQLLVCSSRKAPAGRRTLTFACLLRAVCLAANVEYTTSFYNHGDPLAGPDRHLHLKVSV
jgi:hypothetical protein